MCVCVCVGRVQDALSPTLDPRMICKCILSFLFVLVWLLALGYPYLYFYVCFQDYYLFPVKLLYGFTFCVMSSFRSLK